jgi:hypothetical protein
MVLHAGNAQRDAINVEVHKIGGGYHAGSTDQYVTLCPEHHREVEQHARYEPGCTMKSLASDLGRDERNATPSFLVF